MRRILLTVIISAISVCYGYSQTQNIDFRILTLKQAKQVAAEEDRFVLIYVYDRNSPKINGIAKNIFMDQAVADYINSSFVSITYDTREDYGFNPLSRFNLSKEPAIIILNKKGTEAGRIVGMPYKTPDEFISILDNILMYNAMIERQEAAKMLRKEN